MVVAMFSIVTDAYLLLFLSHSLRYGAFSKPYSRSVSITPPPSVHEAQRHLYLHAKTKRCTRHVRAYKIQKWTLLKRVPVAVLPETPDKSTRHGKHLVRRSTRKRIVTTTLDFIFQAQRFQAQRSAWLGMRHHEILPPPPPFLMI